jgi:hypothetical protein
VDPGNVTFFMVPASKNGEPIIDEIDHLTCYDIGGTFTATVTVANQFGLHDLEIQKPDALCVPTEKFPPAPVPLLRDHYKCYEASGPLVGAPVNLLDQFGPASVTLIEPVLFCNPVDKNGEGISNDFDHLTCYQTEPPGVPVGLIPFLNQFHEDVLDVGPPVALCVPSEKLGWTTTTSTTTTTTLPADPCEFTPWPICNGFCPPGLFCRPDPGTCQCLP